jgi:hypothetical protein
MAKRKRANDDPQNSTQKTKDRPTRTSCSTCGTRCVTLVINPVTNNDRIVITTSGTYPWSFVAQIFLNGYQGHGGARKTFEAMTSTKPLGTLGSVASLVLAILYQGNLYRNHKPHLLK